MPHEAIILPKELSIDSQEVALCEHEAWVAGAGLDDIRTLLLDGITTQMSSGVRFCSVQWAVRLFPFSDAAARYICMLAAADTKIEVREAGLNGLKQELFKADSAGEQPPLASFCL